MKQINNQVQFGEFSLLWKNVDTMQSHVFSLDKNVIKDLGLYDICSMLAETESQYQYLLEQMSNLCCDAEEMQYRQEIFCDFYYNEELCDAFSDALLSLQTLEDLQKYRIKQPDNREQQLWKMINYLKELQVYVEALEKLRTILSDSNIASEGLFCMKNLLDSICNESGFSMLQKDISALTDDVSKIKSLTLGVNLDENLNPTEVILTSMNEAKVSDSTGIMSGFKEFIYKSAALNNGDFRLVHKMKQAPLTERSSLMLDLTKNIEHILGNIMTKLKKSLAQYVNLQGYGFIRLIPEIQMYLSLVSMFKQLEANGFTVSRPSLVPDREGVLHFKDLYNIRLAFSMTGNEKNEMVFNDLCFDDTHNIYILTGPNRGGKTILTQAVGQAVIFMQLGVFVPCSHMEAGIVSGIFTHFPADENDTISYGRLGEEAMRINNIVKRMNKGSLLLLNETYATTSFSDGLYMAKDLIKYLKLAHVNCIYNTHMHELASDIANLNTLDGDGVIASLVMGIEGGKRLYKVRLCEPDKNSYAADIAFKYGVTFEQLMTFHMQTNN